MSRKAVSEGYSSSAVCEALGLPRTTFDAWMLRGYLPLPAGPGTGRARALSLLDAVRIGTIAQLHRLGIPLSLAGGATRLVQEHVLKPHRHDAKWMMVIAPTSAQLASDTETQLEGGGMQLGPKLVGPYSSPVELADHVRELLFDPMAYVVVDLTAIVRRVERSLAGHAAEAP
jgi:hypothetical protein